MTATFTQPRWAELLAEALEKPGFILEAYRRLRGYSLGNQIAALSQCHERRISPGPTATLRRRPEGHHGADGALALHADHGARPTPSVNPSRFLATKAATTSSPTPASPRPTTCALTATGSGRHGRTRR